MNVLRWLVLIWACGVPLAGLIFLRWWSPYPQWERVMLKIGHAPSRKLYRLIVFAFAIAWPYLSDSRGRPGASSGLEDREGKEK